MAEGQRLVTVGWVGAVPVDVDVRELGSDLAARVVLGAQDYTAIIPVGFPVRPALIGTDRAHGGTHTFTAGSTVALLRCEAAALCQLGFATLETHQ